MVEEALNLPEKYTLNAVTLSKELTKGKVGEKEKFDAIFTWVSYNIRYNYKIYYAAGGTSMTNVQRVLKYRSGICLDYATLMDTLCTYAGLTNVSVYGYAKDEIFDVNDSIYLDNHAWNAVKLNGLWYLYDVTWAAGSTQYDYTNFSKWIIKLQDRVQPKYKKKKIKQRKLIFTEKCDATYDAPAYRYKPRFFNDIAGRLLFKIRLHVKQTHIRDVNPDFYLTEPGLFSVTHMADNPVWSLVPGKTMRDFESDSSFYHLDGGDYKKQIRAGKECAECEENVQLSELNKIKNFKSQSLAFNPRNHFVASFSDYHLGDMSFKQSKNEIDSASKINLLDTSNLYFKSSLVYLRQSKKNLAIEYALQKKKNKAKQSSLLNDNKSHTSFVRAKVRTTLTQRRNVTSLMNKSLANIRKYWKRRADISGLKSEVFVDTKSRVSEKKIESMKLRLKERDTEIDSLNKIIVAYKVQIDSVLMNLSLNVWQKVIHHDSLILPIVKTTRLRNLAQDDYKKSIVETRKLIPEFKLKYARDLDNTVYTPVEFISSLAPLLFKTIDKRYSCEKDRHRLKLLLVKIDQLPLTDLKAHIETLQNERLDDYCWLRSGFPSLIAAAEGFESLEKKQKLVFDIISFENHVERKRASKINKELLRRKKKYENIVSHNSHVSRVQLTKVKSEKRAYLKNLERRRREEK